MASDKAKATPNSFSEGTKVQKLDSHTYRVNLSEAFCLGAAVGVEEAAQHSNTEATVPNGGYAASCMLAAASAHLSSRGQSDTLTAHFEYPGRTAAGPAIVAVEDVKLAGQLSTLHLTLWQGGLLPHAPWIAPAVSRRVVLAYTNHTNLGSFAGMSLPTGYEVTAAAALPSPMPDFERLIATGADDAWEEAKAPAGPSSSSDFTRSLRNWNFYEPRAGPLTPGALDMWVRFASGERLTQAALPYVVDSFPFNLHTFLAAPEVRQLLLEPPPAPQQDPTGAARAEDLRKKDRQRAGLWFPTVVMNLEAKKALPDEGVEWLAVRVTSKQIREGKFDIDVLVRDVEGEMVALSHHVAMIVSMEKNTREKGASAKAAL